MAKQEVGKHILYLASKALARKGREQRKKTKESYLEWQGKFSALLMRIERDIKEIIIKLKSPFRWLRYIRNR